MNQASFFLVFIMILSFVTPAMAAMGAGDVIALLLGLAMFFILVLAGLGFYARKSGAVFLDFLIRDRSSN